MKAEQYQIEAQKTAVYPKENEWAYLTLGLIGEVGEFANQLKKALRDDAGGLTPERAGKLLDELGDVCWYIAMLTNATSLCLPNVNGDPFSTLDALIDYECFEIAESALKFTDPWLVNRHVPERLLFHVANAAVALGSTLEAVLDRNIAKLAVRQERGTLHGSGDTR